MVSLKQHIQLTLNDQIIELTTEEARELYALLGDAIGSAPAPTPVPAYPSWSFPIYPSCGSSFEPTAIVSSHGYKPQSDTLSSFLPKTSTILGDPPAGFFWEHSSGETQLKPWLPMRNSDGTSEIPETPVGWKRINPEDHMSPLVRI